MDFQNVLWLLSLVLQTQDFICGASLGLDDKYEFITEKKEIQGNSNVPHLQHNETPGKRMQLKRPYKKKQLLIRKPPLVKNKWDLKKLQTHYDINPDHSYRSSKDDTNPYDLKISVDGIKVKVLSSPKSRKNSSNVVEEEGARTGHIIEIVPNTMDEEESDECEEEDSSDLGLKIDISKPEKFSEDEPTSNSNQINEDIIGFNEEGSGEARSGEDLIFDSGKESDNGPNKSSRGIMDVFFRTNNSLTSCKTPTGEPGHCKRMTECLLSDALSNFSLFLQYLCLMRGPFVGMCCPDNPVIETKDVDNTTETTVQEFKQPEEGCGKNSNLRIVGGTVSVPHEWTWMVALLRRNRFFCGGVIINNWYVLTAAHCVLGIKVKDLTVRLGEYNFSEKNLHQRDIPIAEIKRHAQFVTLTFQHDIALLKLKKQVEYSKFIGSICLPEPNEDYSQVNATVVGWGTVSFGGAASPILRQVKIPIWSNEECDKTYSLESITDSFMCAGSPENGEDACQGDSGGPLMVMNKDKRWEVVGIVSWGRRCGDPTYPGVYARVSTYLDWIKENIN